MYWIESTTDIFIAKSIHFDNFPIIYHFSTIYLLNTKINWFSMMIHSFSKKISIFSCQRNFFWKVPIIKKQDRFFHRFGGTIIIGIAKGNSLTDINVFLMILFRAITSHKVTKHSSKSPFDEIIHIYSNTFFSLPWKGYFFHWIILGLKFVNDEDGEKNVSFNIDALLVP